MSCPRATVRWRRDNACRDEGGATHGSSLSSLTSEPAAFFGFSNKGQLAPGFDADLIMFDPDAVKLNPQESTNDLPGGKARIVERSEGFAYTIVGGQVVLDDSEYQGVTPGRVI